jgi:hypothetical protein
MEQLLTNNMGTKQEDKIIGKLGIVVGIHYWIKKELSFLDQDMRVNLDIPIHDSWKHFTQLETQHAYIWENHSLAEPLPLIICHTVDCGVTFNPTPALLGFQFNNFGQ